MLIGVSNTIDTLTKYSKSIAINIKEIKNIVFEPYEKDHVMKIIS